MIFLLDSDNIISDSENMSLIALNQLRLGRNIDWNPATTKKVTGNLDKIFKQNKRIFNLWFEAWLVYHVEDQSIIKNAFLGHNMKICDAVLLLKQHGILGYTYRYD